MRLSHLVGVPVSSVDPTVLVVKLHSAGDGLAEGEACNTQIVAAHSLSQRKNHNLPEVSVLAVPSLAQTGSVTCFATRECFDLISGKELDMLRSLVGAWVGAETGLTQVRKTICR